MATLTTETDTLPPKQAYAGGKAIGKAQERRAVTMYLRRYADALEVQDGACCAEVANTLRTLSACISDGHHSEGQ